MSDSIGTGSQTAQELMTAADSRLPAPAAHYRLALAALMLTVAAVFWRALFTSDVLFYRDVAFLHYAHAFELRQLVRGGHWPLWNPFEHFGEPVAANPVYLLFYPTTWLAWILPAAYGFKLHYILHFFLAGAGSFLLARRIKLGPLACYAAGALFVFSGPVMSLGNFVNFLPAAAWMPWAILAADHLVVRGGWRAAGLLAGALTLQFFAGEPLTSLATAALCSAWMFGLYGEWRGPLLVRVNRLLFGRLLLALGLTAGFSAIQLFPAAWHTRFTERAAELTFQDGLFWSLHPLKILEMLVPELWGNALFDSNPWLYIEGPYLLLSVFIGLLPLLFAVNGACKEWGRPPGLPFFAVRRALAGLEACPTASRRGRTARFWAISGAFAFLLALGRFTPAGSVFYHLIPVFQVLRFPVKLLLPVVLAVAQLAAIGMDRLLAPAPAWHLSTDRGAPPLARPARLLAYVFVALAAVWLAAAAVISWRPEAADRLLLPFSGWAFDWERALSIGRTTGVLRTEMIQRAAAWLAYVIPARLPYVAGAAMLTGLLLLSGKAQRLRARIVLCAGAAAILQLIATHYSINPVVSRRFFEDPSPALRLMDAHRSPDRPLRVFAEPARPQILAAPRLAIDIGQLDFLPSAAQVPYVYRLGLQVSAPWDGLAGTFSVDAEHFLPAPQERLTKLVFDRGVAGEKLARLLRASSVDYAVFVRYESAQGLRHVGDAPNGSLTPAKIYRVEERLPRAYLVHEAVSMYSKTGAIDRLMSADFDPAHAVMLHSAARSETARDGDERLQLGVPDGAEAVTITHSSPLRVEIDADARAPGFLVLNDSYDPDWRVEVDGRTVELRRANQVFRAVPILAGRHRVVFRYRPLALFAGAAVTLLTVLLALALSWPEGRRRSSQPASARLL